MKVYYLVVSALCMWTPTRSQFFYSHYTPLTQVSPVFPQTFLPPLPAVPAPAAYSFPPNPAVPASTAPTSEYRGFGYRTDYNDGATSTVFYVTGPEATHLRSFKDFPNFTRQVQDPPAAKARSLASDLTDVNAIPNAEQKIQNVLQPAEFQKLFDSIAPGVVNFYTFPASTVPLSLARQLNTTTNTTTTTEEPVPAESIVNPKVIINDVDNSITSNVTTEAATTEVVNTTEASTETDSVAVEAKEKSTTTEETTTETTTEV